MCSATKRGTGLKFLDYLAHANLPGDSAIEAEDLNFARKCDRELLILFSDQAYLYFQSCGRCLRLATEAGLDDGIPRLA